MEEVHERAATIEPGHDRQQGSIDMPISPTGNDNVTRVEDSAVRRLVRRINQEHAAVVRLLKASLRAILKGGASLSEGQALLGSAFPHWVQTKLSLTTAEAGFLLRSSLANSGISEEDLLPTREVKLARLVRAASRLDSR